MLLTGHAANCRRASCDDLAVAMKINRDDLAGQLVR